MLFRSWSHYLHVVTPQSLIFSKTDTHILVSLKKITSSILVFLDQVLLWIQCKISKLNVGKGLYSLFISNTCLFTLYFISEHVNKTLLVNYLIADLLMNFKLNNSSNILIWFPVTINISIYHIKKYLMKYHS